MFTYEILAFSYERFGGIDQNSDLVAFLPDILSQLIPQFFHTFYLFLLK